MSDCCCVNDQVARTHTDAQKKPFRTFVHSTHNIIVSLTHYRGYCFKYSCAQWSNVSYHFSPNLRIKGSRRKR